MHLPLIEHAKTSAKKVASGVTAENALAVGQNVSRRVIKERIKWRRARTGLPCPSVRKA